VLDVTLEAPDGGPGPLVVFVKTQGGPLREEGIDGQVMATLVPARTGAAVQNLLHAVLPPVLSHASAAVDAQSLQLARQLDERLSAAVRNETGDDAGAFETPAEEVCHPELQLHFHACVTSMCAYLLAPHHARVCISGAATSPGCAAGAVLAGERAEL